jgi:hypothetical protein
MKRLMVFVALFMSVSVGSQLQLGLIFFIAARYIVRIVGSGIRKLAWCTSHSLLDCTVFHGQNEGLCKLKGMRSLTECRVWVAMSLLLVDN